MAENANRILLNKGRAYCNGEVIFDGIKCEINVSPTVTQSRSLGERTSSRRWAGVEYPVTVSEYRTTSRTKDYIKAYQETGLAPELTIQGVQDDEGSDYVKANGADIVTATGCIITSDIGLINLDASSTDHVVDEITMNAKNIKF